jgi:anti-sigma factor ChrR (cupin superfamily)
MKIHANMNERASERVDDLPWRPSPDGSVDRRMLDRDGTEIARATSIVRYPKGSRFPTHVHGGGEEFLVLEGVFSDEHDDYPIGSYVRNPPGSSHAPFSNDGCVIFVKLQQFEENDSKQSVVDTSDRKRVAGPHKGWTHQLLHRHYSEEVMLVRIESGSPAADIEWQHGAEFLILDGEIADAQGHYCSNSWLRLPAGSRQRLVAKGGALFYLKTGHLPRIECV